VVKDLAEREVDWSQIKGRILKVDAGLSSLCKRGVISEPQLIRFEEEVIRILECLEYLQRTERKKFRFKT